MNNKIITAFMLFASLVPLTSSGAQVNNSQETTTQVANSITISTSPAADWQLTEEEWQLYQRLMQGPSGRWYRELSPPAVLGLNAATLPEQQHFARLAAQQEHDKITRELAFNQAFTAALRELYPAEPIIRRFELSPFNPNPHGPAP